MEDINSLLGDWGRFQKRLFVLLALPVALMGFQTMMVIIIFAVPDHRCQLQQLGNDTFDIRSGYHRALVDSAIPLTTKDGVETYDQCHLYADINGTHGNRSSDLIGCSSWVFDHSDFESTVMTQFNLVCDKKDFRAHFNMINMAGVFVGSPLVGFLCDWMGRKPSYFVCLLILTVVGTISAFPPSVPVFLVYRFLSGVANIGTYLSLYVLALEVVGPSKRTFASSLLAVVWLVGPFLVAGLSYVVKDWWKIQIISSAPLVLSFATWWAVVTMAYYGLSLNVSNLVGNVRVNFMLSNTVELVGYVAAWILLDRVGRKRLHCGFMLLAGSAMLATIPTVIFGGTELQWLTTALAMVGKLGVSASFSVIYLMSAELYPTVIRNFGMGCSSTVARVGSAVSPYIADLGLYIEGSFGRALPLIVFGGLAVTAGLLSLMLPETLHRKLPDTLEEAANFGKKEKVTEDREDALEMDGHLPKENQRLQESADTPD